MNDNDQFSTPSRRAILKAGAWSVPVVALAGATPAVANSPTGAGWVAAVRITNPVTNSSAAPGFRFGHAGSRASVTVTVTFTPAPAQPGLALGDVFNTFNGTHWSWPGESNGAYTTTATFSVGASDFNDAAPVPGSTNGLTIKGKHGQYSAVVTLNAAADHYAAALTYPQT